MPAFFGSVLLRVAQLTIPVDSDACLPGDPERQRQLTSEDAISCPPLLNRAAKKPNAITWEPF